MERNLNLPTVKTMSTSQKSLYTMYLAALKSYVPEICKAMPKEAEFLAKFWALSRTEGTCSNYFSAWRGYKEFCAEKGVDPLPKGGFVSSISPFQLQTLMYMSGRVAGTFGRTRGIQAESAGGLLKGVRAVIEAQSVFG